MIGTSDRDKTTGGRRPVWTTFDPARPDSAPRLAWQTARLAAELAITLAFAAAGWAAWRWGSDMVAVGGPGWSFAAWSRGVAAEPRAALQTAEWAAGWVARGVGVLAACSMVEGFSACATLLHEILFPAERVED